MVYFKRFEINCLRCGSEDIEIQNISGAYTFTCYKCGNSEEEGGDI